MAEADLDHPALEKVPFYEARLIHRKDIHTASVHSTGQLYIPFPCLPDLRCYCTRIFTCFSVMVKDDRWLYPVTAFSTEQVKSTASWIHVKLVFNDCTQSVDRLSHIGIPSHNIKLAGSCYIA
mgnify:CR=1 FL=1